MRSGGRAQTTALCMEARFLADRLAASRRTDPNLRARSIISVLSESEGRQSRRRSKERSREIEEESERANSDSKRESMSEEELGTLGFGIVLGLEPGEGEGGEQQGRLSLGLGEGMDGEWRRRVSISISL